MLLLSALQALSLLVRCKRNVHHLWAGARHIYSACTRYPRLPSSGWSTQTSLRAAHQRLRFLSLSCLDPRCMCAAAELSFPSTFDRCSKTAADNFQRSKRSEIRKLGQDYNRVMSFFTLLVHWLKHRQRDRMRNSSAETTRPSRHQEAT